MKMIYYILLFCFLSTEYFGQYYETYPKDDNITMDGEIKDGKLWNGRHYIYDEYGLLDHIEVYKEGQYVGNGVIGGKEEIQKDTINQLDKDGKKTGFWKITGKIHKRVGYSDSAVIEEGNYLRGRKVGDWIKYWPNGSFKQEAFYINGRLNGFFITYYESGGIWEKGYWKGSEPIKEFKSYYKSGCLQYNKFYYKDSTYSEYYFDNCDSIILEKGELELSFSSFPDKSGSTNERLYYKSDSIKPTRLFIEPYPKTYNSNGDILMDGEFKKGRLWTGRYYIYTEQGLLDHIEVYKEGKFVGNGVLKGK